MIQFRSPVKREGAERYLLITLISFAVSVVLTRVYLELTGYPQLGNGVLHIAHVLWGGLLLFVAALLPTLFANRWVYMIGALLGGVGVGLFIDEVGKFITQSNDYFFPFAAPIIYAFFLLTVILYLQFRRPSKHDSRTELYSALDQIMELIENDLDERERDDLEARLERVVADAQYPEHARLAEALLAVLNSDTLHIVDPNPNIVQRSIVWLQDLTSRLISQTRYRLLLVIGLAVAGVGSLVELIVFAAALISPDLLQQLAAGLLLSEQLINGPNSLIWFLVLIALSGVTGLLLIVGGALLFVRRDRLGSEISYLGLLVSLATATPLLFYFDQFAAVGTTLWEFALLIGLLSYRRVYLGVGSNIDVLSHLGDKTNSPAELEE